MSVILQSDASDNHYQTEHLFMRLLLRPGLQLNIRSNSSKLDVGRITLNIIIKNSSKIFT
jgi:hypothetical protein